MTEDERLRRQAIRKAERLNEKARDEAGPLFADQLDPAELTTPEAEYWKARRGWACEGGKGADSAELWQVDQRWNRYVVRRVARRYMKPEEFAIAAERDRDFGSWDAFWRNILAGGPNVPRMMLAATRVSHGWKPVYSPTPREPDRILCYVEHIELIDRLIWPPADWTPPLTREDFDALIATPAAEDLVQPVDPWNLLERAA